MGNKRSVRLIAVLLILVMFLGVCPTALLAQALSDVGEHWAKEAINLWTARGIVKGYEDGTFGPDRFITRAEFAALLNRTFGFTTVSPKEFPDVSDTAWYAEEVAKAAGAGYMEGYEDGSFRPDNNITRQEAALVFARIYNLEQIDESYDFSDFDSIPDWSRKAVVAVAKAGLMQGYPDGSFGPARNITRAETVSVLDRLVAEIFTEDGTYGDAGEATVINGNAIITAADVTLVNMHIKGNLLIAESVGDGTVVLDNVVVDGELDVRGGGPASVVLENSKVVSLTVSKDGVRIVIRGSKVDEARVKSASTIEQDPDAEGIEVLIIEEIPAEGEVVLLGDYGNLTVKAVAGKIVVESGHVDEVVVDETATDVEVVLGSGSSVSNLVLDAPATVSGSGKIEKATVNASGAVIEPEPEEVELGEDVSAIIGGEEVVYVPEEEVPGAPPEPEEPVYIPVSRISVDPEELVLTVGETDRIRATVRPSSATNRRVRWSSSDETAVTVDSNGNITAVGPGKAVITATSAANSSIKDSCSIRVFPEYDITVGLREWSKDRTEPESWRISDDWIVYSTKTEPNNNWYAWQGRKSETDMKVTDAWKVETAVHITEALLARDGVRTSMWLNVVNEEGTTIDWAILQFKRENNENGWQYWLSAEGEWVDIGGMPVTEGVHELAIHFSAGEIVLLIDGKEVESYQLESTLTYVKEVILNSYSYGESYEVKWKVPEVRAWARVVNEDTKEGFYTIQDAISDADEWGATISVRPGTYYESVLIDRPLKLVGPNAGKPGYSDDRTAEAIIKGKVENGLSPLLELDAEKVVIDGFTFDNIRIDNYNQTSGTNTNLIGGLSILNNRFVNTSGTAIYLRDGRNAPGEYSSDVKICGNLIERPTSAGEVDYNAGSGIIIMGAENLTVSDNRIIEPAYNGIQLARNKNATIANNMVIDSGQPAVQIAQWNDEEHKVINNILSTQSKMRGAIRLYGFTQDYNPKFVITDNEIQNSVYGIQIGTEKTGSDPYNDIRDADYVLEDNTFDEVSKKLIVYLHVEPSEDDIEEMNALFQQVHGEGYLADRISDNPYTYVAVLFPVYNENLKTYYRTLQEAISAATEGDTVLVLEGTYYLSSTLNIHKAITVQGVNKEAVVLIGSSQITTTVHLANGATLRSVTITRDNDGEWTDNQNMNLVAFGNNLSETTTLEECIIRYGRNGVVVNNTSNVVIKNNLIANNRTGIQMQNKVDATVEGNTIIDNYTIGVLLQDLGWSNDHGVPTFSDNVITDNWYSDFENRWKDEYVVDLTGNEFTDLTYKIADSSGEPGYDELHPKELGGTATRPTERVTFVMAKVGNITYEGLEIETDESIDPEAISPNAVDEPADMPEETPVDDLDADVDIGGPVEDTGELADELEVKDENEEIGSGEQI